MYYVLGEKINYVWSEFSFATFAESNNYSLHLAHLATHFLSDKNFSTKLHHLWTDAKIWVSNEMRTTSPGLARLNQQLMTFSLELSKVSKVTWRTCKKSYEGCVLWSWNLIKMFGNKVRRPTYTFKHNQKSVIQV